jgi:hypothetical protein
MAAEKDGTRWTPKEVQQLRKEAAGNTPTRVIGLHLERTPEAVQAKASREHISLKPTNQRPYGTGGQRKPAK